MLDTLIWHFLMGVGLYEWKEGGPIWPVKMKDHFLPPLPRNVYSAGNIFSPVCLNFSCESLQDNLDFQLFPSQFLLVSEK